MKTRLAFKDLPKDYRGLLSLHMVRPIHDKIDYANAIEVLDALAGHDLNHDQDDYFEALCLLVEVYELAHSRCFSAKRG